ncbi:hypothetical protein HY025_04635 [Candidatus Daviesbacteria bacterium]|nr:hypothetical protein [Candidatus Daviesbacteria bacterium]
MLDRLRELRPDLQGKVTSLTREVSSVRQGFQPPNPTQKFIDFYGEWDHDKPERNALAAILIARASLRTYQAIPTRPPFGFLPAEAAGEEASKLLKTPLVVGNTGNEYNPTQLIERLKALEVLQKKTFSSDIRQEIGDLLTAPGVNSNRQVLFRLDHLVSKADDRNDIPLGTQAFWFLVRGMSTNTQVDRYAVELSIDLCRKHLNNLPTLNQLVEFSPLTYPVVASLASLNLDTFVVVMNQLSAHLSDRFNANFFELNSNSDGNFTVKVSDLFWERLSRQKGFRSPEAVTTRCPGLVPYRHTLGQSTPSPTQPNPIKTGFEVYLNAVSKILTIPQAA